MLYRGFPPRDLRVGEEGRRLVFRLQLSLPDGEVKLDAHFTLHATEARQTAVV